MLGPSFRIFIVRSECGFLIGLIDTHVMVGITAPETFTLSESSYFYLSSGGWVVNVVSSRPVLLFTVFRL